jgi:hypothetical protein
VGSDQYRLTYSRLNKHDRHFIKVSSLPLQHLRSGLLGHQVYSSGHSRQADFRVFFRSQIVSMKNASRFEFGWGSYDPIVAQAEGL